MANAPAADQARLLDVQDVDTRVQQAQHRRDAHPTVARLAELRAAAAEVDAALVTLTTEAGDVRREVTKAEDDVASVRSRAERDRAKLDSGAGSPKDLQALQSELELLGRRIADLEDVELAAMEKLEAAEVSLAEQQARKSEIAAEVAAQEAQQAEAFGVIDAELAALAAEREEKVAGLDAGLLAMYQKLRESHGGTGAAALERGQCQGCHMDVNPGDLAAMQAAPDDQIFRCEECGRILVRGATA